MGAHRWILGVLLATLAACDSGESAKARADTNAEADPPAQPSPKASAESPPVAPTEESPGRDGDGDELAAPAVEPPQALPEWSDFEPAAATDGWSKPAKASTRERLGPHRAVAVIRTEQGEAEDARWRITAVRLEWDGAAWQPAGARELQRWSAHEDLGRDGKIAVNLRVDDVDDDGELEILTRFKLDWMCCGGGATHRRTLVIVNDDPKMSEAAYLDLDEEIYIGGTVGKERFEDRNADGHGDLIVAWKSTIADEPPDEGEHVHQWRPRGNRFEGARRPDPEECSCE